MKSGLSFGVLAFAVVSMACTGDSQGPVGPSAINGHFNDATRPADSGGVVDENGTRVSAAREHFDINNPAPARVTHGVVTVTSSDQVGFNISGTKGFRFIGSNNVGDNIFDQFPLLPGSTYTLGLQVAPAFQGTLTYQGTDYDINAPDSFGSLEITTPPITLPTVMASSLDVSVPFSISGTFGKLVFGEEVFVALTGSGVAEVTLAGLFQSDFSYYSVVEVRYTFTAK